MENIGVYNVNCLELAFTQKNGHFRILASMGDVIEFHCLGYHIEYIYVDNLEDSLFLQMREKVYELDEATVFTWNGYRPFKSAVLDYQPPDELNMNFRLDNVELVKQITGLEAVNSAYLFMPYCNLQEEYLAIAGPNEIIV